MMIINLFNLLLKIKPLQKNNKIIHSKCGMWALRTELGINSKHKLIQVLTNET